MIWLRFPRVIGVIVAIYLALVTVLFARLSMENHSFLRTASSTQGTVVALVPKTFSGGARPQSARRDRGIPLAPEIRYTVAGTSYTYTPSHGRYKPNVKIGDRVTIIYDPDDPQQTARMKGEGRVVIPVITTGFGLVTALVVVGLVATRRFGRSSSPGRSDRPPPRAAAPHRSPVGSSPAGPAAGAPSSAATPVRPRSRRST